MDQYKTKGNAKVWVLGTGEETQQSSSKVIPWNEKTDKWYDLNAADKQKTYDYTCARMTSDFFWKKLSDKQKSDYTSDKLSIFQHVKRVDIPNPELMMFFYGEDSDDFLVAWVSLNDLERIH